jgi:hypothetical protein
VNGCRAYRETCVGSSFAPASDAIFLDHLTVSDLEDSVLVAVVTRGVTVNAKHPIAQAAMRDDQDPAALAFIGSAVVTAFNRWSIGISDAHEFGLQASLLRTFPTAA